MSDPSRWVFRCPDCGHSVRVDETTRELVLRGGCVVCGAAVPRESFRAAGAAGDGGP